MPQSWSPYTMKEPYFQKKFCHRIWLFYLYTVMWIQPFSPMFPCRALWLRYIVDYLFKFCSVIVCGCFISTVRWKYGFFIRFSPLRNLWLMPFSGYPFGSSRKKASIIFYNTALNFKRWNINQLPNGTLGEWEWWEACKYLEKKLCHRNWLMLFPLKFQVNDQ